MSCFAQYSARKPTNLLTHHKEAFRYGLGPCEYWDLKGELNEIQQTICCYHRVARRAGTHVACSCAGHYAIHHHNDSDSTCLANGEHHHYYLDSGHTPANGEHHHYLDSGNIPANSNHADEGKHHQVQAPSQERAEREGNKLYNHDSWPAGTEYVDDHHHSSPAVIPGRQESEWVRFRVPHTFAFFANVWVFADGILPGSLAFGARYRGR
jgi:hypothetical protein